MSASEEPVWTVADGRYVHACYTFGDSTENLCDIMDSYLESIPVTWCTPAHILLGSVTCPQCLARWRNMAQKEESLMRRYQSQINRRLRKLRSKPDQRGCPGFD